jgi:hypothetical protein
MLLKTKREEGIPPWLKVGEEIPYRGKFPGIGEGGEHGCQKKLKLLQAKQEKVS